MSSRPRGPYRPGQYQAPQAPSRPQKPEHAKRDAYDWATLWIAGVGVLIVAVSAVIQAWAAILSQHQIAVMKEQIAVAAAEQRPWISPSMPIDGELSAWNKEQVFVGFQIPVKNTGSVAARDVNLEVDIIGGYPSNEGKSADLISGKLKKLCARADDESSTGATISLFPGEVTNIDVARVVNILDDNIAVADRGKVYLKLFVAGCISYRHSAAVDARHTPFGYEIEYAARPSFYDNREAWDHLDAIQWRGGRMAVKFRRSLFGNGSAD